MYFKQTDKKWGNEIMTHHPDQKEPDYLKDWGCFVTSITNILKHRGKLITPKTLNEQIIHFKGYAYLRDPNTPVSSASNLLNSVIEKIYDCDIIRDYKDDLIHDVNSYFIGVVSIKTRTQGVINHFVNIIKDLGNKIKIFDVYTGEERDIFKTELKRVVKIKF